MSGDYADSLHASGFKKPRLYGTLDQLVTLGVLYDTYEPSDKGGGIRRMYRLTPLGQQVYEHLKAIDALLK